jgi:hypothetical protein
MKHLVAEELEAGLAKILSSPKESGRLLMIVRRPDVGARELLEQAELDEVRGLVGDNWLARGSSQTSDGAAHLEMQLTLMNSRVIALIATETQRWPLAGDQLYVDLDLSKANLPTGTRLSIGTAVVEVTGTPHLGCKKFVARFGLDAMTFVNSRRGKRLALRGINARIAQSGTIRRGDAVTKIA